MENAVLITGASSGIGYELARVFAKNGYNLVISSRSILRLETIESELEKEFGIQVFSIEMDFSLPKSAEMLYKKIKENNIDIDVLINNAGVGVYGKFDSTSLDNEMDMVNINVITTTVLTKLFLKDMLKKERGGILNLASLGSFQPGPLMSVYYATKAYILYFTEAIAEEFQDSKILISALCPGPTDTYFDEKSGMAGTRIMETKAIIMTPKEVAEIAYRDFMNNKRIIIPGIKNKMARQMERILPREWIAHLYKSLHEKSE